MREKRMQYVRRYQAETTWLYETAIQKADEAVSSKKMVRDSSGQCSVWLPNAKMTVINSSSCWLCW
ncbi:hypothetical protein M404DRAFT_992205 [Pisolithus tinctorius Marx 270]|uniref:Uncharacterized protein n=1 Tax=Pisolithus tinctorius Marx 270 TaxID=870435 RepID=A0A0C3PIK7_PISTI|nr:hypothetical protein M404DRAFT_992205 [Pisolithus tinctorius Marx 270]